MKIRKLKGDNNVCQVKLPNPVIISTMGHKNFCHVYVPNGLTPLTGP